ncbi:hydrolase [Lithospermum erythrorhizon]|uniref:Hydrolase n=1 Tax=Lithospermum erythrorhizon TaxID=34254 RepID=A0AAV3QSI8_LITER
MIRLCSRSTRRCFLRRPISSSSPKKDAIQLHNEPPSRFTQPRSMVVVVSAAFMAFYAFLEFNGKGGDLEELVSKSQGSIRKMVSRMKQTGAAATVLWKSLYSVMSVRSGFELRVAALLADIAAANESRRAAIVAAGGGAVLDWLLETASSSSQSESARALAYLISDPTVCHHVLGRPNAVPHLLRFIFSAQPRRSKNQARRTSFDLSNSLKGRSMLVAAVMDVVTSNCDKADDQYLNPLLPQNASMRDIAAAIEVIEEGCMHWDEPHGGEDDDSGDNGIKGIGIKILEGTTVLGLARVNDLSDHDSEDLQADNYAQRGLLFNRINGNYQAREKLSSSVVPGLWDDLHSEHVAVPFAAWALANWAMASEVNRSHIQELDIDGHAVMTALSAPERSVKWHGSLVARLLLEDRSLPLSDSVSEWSSSLLSTVSQATKSQDISLAQMALSAFLISIERSPMAQELVMEKGLHLMRDAAKQTAKHNSVQEALARALELLCNGELHISIEESQKWSGILLPWVFGRHSSDSMRTSAIKILSYILEDYGPSSIPISQGWLTIMLNDILSFRKETLAKGNTRPIDQVKTQIDQTNVVSASQIANQLAGSVVNLAGKQLGTVIDTDDTFPLSDLLSLEPFVGLFKNLKKDKMPKMDAADSAVATLRGMKALTDLCAEDPLCLDKMAQCGVMCLIRRLLLEDDYEQLAAIEAYNASRALEAQERTPVSGEPSLGNTNDQSSLRVPPSAHIRRHAARLLTVISVLPRVQNAIFADETWLKWLEDCAKGKIAGCNDLKTQSYARATLLNVLCNAQVTGDSADEDVTGNNGSSNYNPCPRYADMIFLINPELPHWTCPKRIVANTTDDSCVGSDKSADDDSSLHEAKSYSHPDDPVFDIVFVHGLRGGPFKTWRLSEDKSSTKSGLVEKIDEEAGKQGTLWPGEWLSADFPHARLFSLKYKTNLTQWSGASLPLQEVSSMLLDRLAAAGIGDRPVIFITHSMGGLVVKQMLHQAKAENKENFVNNTAGIVFYSCPHFGSKLADMPWRMGLVFRPAPTIGELRSGSPRLVELNDFIRNLHRMGTLEVLSFCETKVTPIVEGYGGWAFRMEIVPLESGYPGFGELVVLESTDHVNICKPLSRTDPSYRETLEFLQKLKEHYR